MALYDGAIQNVIDAFSSLPGIGQKGAQRIAFYLLSATTEQVDQLAKSVVDLKRMVRFCDICGNVCESSICPICADPRRDPTVLCVVQEPKDVVSIERTHEFHGLYHVLGGVIDPMSDVRPQDLRIAQLLRRLGPHGALTVDEHLAAEGGEEDQDDRQQGSRQSGRQEGRPGADARNEGPEPGSRQANDRQTDETAVMQPVEAPSVPAAVTAAQRASGSIYASIAARESAQEGAQRSTLGTSAQGIGTQAGAQEAGAQAASARDAGENGQGQAPAISGVQSAAGSHAVTVSLIGRDDVPPVKEVIIALDPDIEGEATTTYLSGLLAPLGITVTRLASGLPVGSDLEYADEMTLARALAGRRRV